MFLTICAHSNSNSRNIPIPYRAARPLAFSFPSGSPRYMLLQRHRITVRLPLTEEAATAGQYDPDHEKRGCHVAAVKSELKLHNKQTSICLLLMLCERITRFYSILFSSIHFSSRCRIREVGTYKLMGLPSRMADRQINCSISDSAYASSSTVTPACTKKFLTTGFK